MVVTGASSGVGRALVRVFGERGARVGLIARNEHALQNAAREIRSAGGEALVLPLDLANAESVTHAAERVIEEFGTIDVWINNAMVSVFSPVLRMRPEEYQRVTDVNYLGTVYGTMAALQHMAPRNSGHIIQIGSALAYRSIPLQSAYCAAKAAVRGFTDSLRSELIHDGSSVKLSMLQLPALNTPQFDVVRSRLPHRAQPVPPIYQPELVAEAALYLLRHPQRELWLTASTTKAIVGQRFIPGLLDKYLASKAYAGQQTERPRPYRLDNVDTTIPGDRGAHGRFDARARRTSGQFWLRQHSFEVAAAAATAALAGAWAVSAVKRTRRVHAPPADEQTSAASAPDTRGAE